MIKNVSIDLKMFEKYLRERIVKDEGKAAAAGIFKDKEIRSDGKSNVGMALAHEFGSPTHNIPERSHFRTAFDKNKKKYLTMVKEGQDLKTIANEMSQDIVNKIATGPFEALQESYAARKGSPHILIETGEYIDAIEGRLVDGGSK